MFLKYFKEKEKFWYKTKNFRKIQVWGVGAAVDQNAYSTGLDLRFGFFFYFLVSGQCIRALFTVSQITLFSNFFIKNGSHNTIYIFKNYFAIVFSISTKINLILFRYSVFNFNKNKLNPNGPMEQPTQLERKKYDLYFLNFHFKEKIKGNY